MTSYIVAGVNKNKRREFLNDFYKENKIDKFDISLINLESSKNAQSIGIEEIKTLQSQISLKPLKSLNKVVVIDDAHLLTVEAQNSLLKTLEEPPDHTFIILSAEKSELLLPTIISRCKIVEIQDQTLNLNDADKSEIETFIRNLPEMKIGEKLKKAEELSKDKDQAIDWIGKLILVLREKFLEEARDTRGTRGTRDTLKAMQSLHTLLKTTNINPRFAIENIFLSI